MTVGDLGTRLIESLLAGYDKVFVLFGNQLFRFRNEGNSIPYKQEKIQSVLKQSRTQTRPGDQLLATNDIANKQRCPYPEFLPV